MKANPTLKKNAINWFEIHVNDMDRATEFYNKILNTALIPLPGSDQIEMRMFPCDEDSGGVSGCLSKLETCQPGVGGTLVYLNVEGELDQVLKRVPANGGKVIHGKTPIPPHGFFGIIEDTEGNAVGLHSSC